MEHLNKIELCGFVGKVTKTGPITHLTLVVCDTFDGAEGSMVCNQTWFSIIYSKDLDPRIEQGTMARVVGKVQVTKYLTSDNKEMPLWTVVAKEVTPCVV